jgi:hypothetical protein
MDSAAVLKAESSCSGGCGLGCGSDVLRDLIESMLIRE